MSKRKPIEEWTVTALLSESLRHGIAAGRWDVATGDATNPVTRRHYAERYRDEHAMAMKYLRELARRAEGGKR